MGRLLDMFQRRTAEGGGALMPFITAGFPSLEVTARLIETIDATGCDAIEIGIPFSDPIADGPLIASTMHQALGGGATPGGVLETVRRVRDRVQVPLIAMVSVSIVERHGGVAFLDDAVDAGFDGLIIPDADLDEVAPIAQEARARSIAFTTLVAPGASPLRIERITSLASEFIYLLTRRGLTGVTTSAPDLADSVASIRASSDLPIAAGFGIATAEHVTAALQHATGAIVGSALVEVIRNAIAQQKDPCVEAGEFLRPLVDAAHAAGEG